MHSFSFFAAAYFLACLMSISALVLFSPSFIFVTAGSTAAMSAAQSAKAGAAMTARKAAAVIAESVRTMMESPARSCPGSRSTQACGGNGEGLPLARVSGATPPQACNRPMSAKRGCVTDCCRCSACYSLSHANGEAGCGLFPSHGADDDFHRLDNAGMSEAVRHELVSTLNFRGS